MVLRTSKRPVRKAQTPDMARNEGTMLERAWSLYQTDSIRDTVLAVVIVAVVIAMTAGPTILAFVQRRI